MRRDGRMARALSWNATIKRLSSDCRLICLWVCIVPIRERRPFLSGKPRTHVCLALPLLLRGDWRGRGRLRVQPRDLFRVRIHGELCLPQLSPGPYAGRVIKVTPRDPATKTARWLAGLASWG